MDGIMTLDRLYLMALAKAGESVGLEAVLQQMQANIGRIYFIAEGTTRADVVVNFHFDIDACNLEVQMRNGEKVAKSVQYAEGIDEFVRELVRAMRSRLLAAPAGAKGRRAA
jgi:hypothetical protein